MLYQFIKLLKYVLNFIQIGEVLNLKKILKKVCPLRFESLELWKF
jgi:hypothetical protein